MIAVAIMLEKEALMLAYILWMSLSLGLINLAVDGQRRTLPARVSKRTKPDSGR